MVNLELQIFRALLFLTSLAYHVVVSSLNECKVRVPVEVVVLLHQDRVVALFHFIEIFDRLEVSMFEVLLLKLVQNDVLLFELFEPDHEDPEILLHFFYGFGLNLSCDSSNITEMMLPYPFDEGLILLHGPV